MISLENLGYMFLTAVTTIVVFIVWYFTQHSMSGGPFPGYHANGGGHGITGFSGFSVGMERKNDANADVETKATEIFLRPNMHENGEMW